MSNARMTADAARVRAAALASAQRLVEAARRSAEELHEQAARQAEAMLRAARAEVERVTEEATSRQAVQQVSWDAPGRVLAAATAEADLVRANAEARAEAMLSEARARAEREATQVVEAARTQASNERRQAAQELQLAWEELAALRELGATLVVHLDRARSLLAPTMGPAVAASRPASAAPARLVAAGAAVDTTTRTAAAAIAPTAPPVAPPPRVQPPSSGSPIPPSRAEPVQVAQPMREPEMRPAPPAARNGTATGEVDLVLPEQADRMTVEVMIAVLREQPGITVRAPIRRNQTLIVPLLVDRPVPLIPILQELPRVVAAVYSPSSSAASSAAGGHIMIELGDR
jgi:F0F1-type ATP synthase membrane subunit b/b'